MPDGFQPPPGYDALLNYSGDVAHDDYEYGTPMDKAFYGLLELGTQVAIGVLGLYATSAVSAGLLSLGTNLGLSLEYNGMTYYGVTESQAALASVLATANDIFEAEAAFATDAGGVARTLDFALSDSLQESAALYAERQAAADAAGYFIGLASVAAAEQMAGGGFFGSGGHQ